MTSQNQKLSAFIQSFKSQHSNIQEDRKNKLLEIASLLTSFYKHENKLNITVICTHNSRRSQLAQIWFELGFYYYGFENAQAYSGGTEETALNHRMAKAISQFGIPLMKLSDGINPIYSISEEFLPISKKYFSKTIDNLHNPSKEFVAIIVCSSADQACPFVPGADKRIYLPYEDPKNYDDTPSEESAYLDKVKEIGQEVLFVLENMQ